MKRYLSLMCAFAAITASASAVKEAHDLAYVEKAGARQRLDLYLPAGVTNPPLLVFVHGGAWVSGDKSEYTALGKALASDGIAVATINYRLSTSPALRHPLHADDLVAALKFLASQSEKLGFDGTRVYLAGHSAGAHMIAYFASQPALQAKLPKEKQVRGYVGISGIYDVPKLVARFPRYREGFIEKAFGADSKKWVDASPVRGTFEKQRWLVIHSPGDELVDLSQSDDFVAALRKKKIPVELVTPKGYDHMQTVKALFNADSVETRAILGFISGKPR